MRIQPKRLPLLLSKIKLLGYRSKCQTLTLCCALLGLSLTLVLTDADAQGAAEAAETTTEIRPETANICPLDTIIAVTHCKTPGKTILVIKCEPTGWDGTLTCPKESVVGEDRNSSPKTETDNQNNRKQVRVKPAKIIPKHPIIQHKPAARHRHSQKQPDVFKQLQRLFSGKVR